MLIKYYFNNKLYICLYFFISIYIFVIDFYSLDLLPVYETTQEELKEEGINSPNNLAVEATYINQNFSQQCLKKSESVKFEHPNPFAEDKGEEVASVGYRYVSYNSGYICWSGCSCWWWWRWLWWLLRWLWWLLRCFCCCCCCFYCYVLFFLLLLFV